MTDLAPTTGTTALAIRDDQADFTDEQRTALTHLGVGRASPGDLAVFFHVVKRTGLDPFARQIYMIERAGKQTIQTGIDGYRLIGRRAADRAAVTLDVSAPLWCHDDGSWREVWSKKWGRPVAARVTITRDGHPFTATALLDEYEQTNRDGAPQAMWAARPAGMLAKCAEALAWRIAFPQDLSGVYVEEELHASTPDPTPPASATAQTPGGLRARAAARQAPTAVEVVPGNPDTLSTPAPPDDTPHDGEEDGFTPARPTGELATDAQRRRLSTLLRSTGRKDPEVALAYLSETLERLVPSTAEVTTEEAVTLIALLDAEVAKLVGDGDPRG